MKYEVTSILVKDAEKLCSTETLRKAYVEKNEFQYKVALDVLGCLVAGGRDTTAILEDTLADRGLIGTIAALDKVGASVVYHLAHGEWLEIEDHLIRALTLAVCREFEWKEALQICRFLTRFQPYDADVLISDSIRAFKGVLNTAKLRNRCALPHPCGWVGQILDRAEDLLIDVMGPAPGVEEIFEQGRLTPGKDPFENKSAVDKANNLRLHSIPRRDYAGVLLQNHRKVTKAGLDWIVSHGQTRLAQLHMHVAPRHDWRVGKTADNRSTTCNDEGWRLLREDGVESCKDQVRTYLVVAYDPDFKPVASYMRKDDGSYLRITSHDRRVLAYTKVTITPKDWRVYVTDKVFGYRVRAQYLLMKAGLELAAGCKTQGVAKSSIVAYSPYAFMRLYSGEYQGSLITIGRVTYPCFGNAATMRKVDITEEFIGIKKMYELWGSLDVDWGQSTSELVKTFTAVVEAVPKSYKTARIIAREDATRQWLLGGLREITWEHMKKWRLKESLKRGKIIPLPVHPTSEAPSQIGAYLGSLDGGHYATVDWSQASDLLAYTLVWRVMPRDHFLLRSSLRARFLRLAPGDMRVNHFWATMGAANTWSDMGLVLWAIAMAVTESVSRMLSEELEWPIMWGDDTLIDDRAATCFVEIMESLGMVCSSEKSYITGPYREACGVEFLNGEEVSSIHWPRHAVGIHSKVEQAKAYATILDLQHRFFENAGVRHALTTYLKTLSGEAFTATQPLEDEASPWQLYAVTREKADPYYPSGTKDPRTKKPLMREVRYVIGATTAKVPKDLHSNPRYHNYLMLKYYEYLERGPQLVDDPVCRALGLTQSRIRPGDFGGGKPHFEDRFVGN